MSYKPFVVNRFLFTNKNIFRMKALKIIGGIVATLVVVYLIMCAMGPSKYDGSTSLKMDAPTSVVYDIVSDVSTWEEWMPWKDQDPSMVLKMGDKTKGLGANYSWTSDMMGGGKLEIVEAEPNKSMKNRLTFEGFEGYSYGIWKFEETEKGKSNVTWGMESENTIPFWMRGMMLMGESLEDTFNRGLNDIKAIAEKKAKEMPKEPKKYRGYTINQIDIPMQNYLAHREKIEIPTMGAFFAKHFPALAGKAGADMTGMPRGIYYEWDMENNMTDMAAAVPVKAAMEVDDFTNIEVPAGKALHIDYYGSFEGSAEAHYAMDDYLKEKGVESALVMEEYVTDPTTEPDTSKWLTKIYYTLK